MTTTATHINLYHVCHRELWLHANGIRMEHTSDIVYEGKLIGETTYTDRANKNKQVEIDGEPLKIPAIMPKLNSTPGRTDWPGGAVGSHNDEVLKGILQLDEEAIDELRRQNVIL